MVEETRGARPGGPEPQDAASTPSAGRYEAPAVAWEEEFEPLSSMSPPNPLDPICQTGGDC